MTDATASGAKQAPDHKADSHKIAILGAGRLAQAVAAILKAAGGDVKLWEHHEDARKALAKEAPPRLKGCEVVGDIEEALDGAGTIFFGVPAPAMSAVADAYAPYALGDHIVLHAARGVGEGFVLPHQAVRDRTAARKIGALGGPLYFDDLERRRPLFVALGARFPEVTRRVTALTDKTPVRLHPCKDVVGIEIAGAISNVSHLAAGMADGLELGQTARGVILCRGLAEATQLGTALGADPATFSGLAGVGDLIPREVSSTARHDEVGRCMASGDSLEDAMGQVEGHVEGVLTAREARDKGRALGLELPLINAVADILDGEADPALRLDEVLDLDLSLGAEAVAVQR